MGEHTRVEASYKQIETAQAGWSSFVVFSKWTIIITCVVVALLGIVFIDW